MERGCPYKENCLNKEMGSPELEPSCNKVDRDETNEGCLQEIMSNVKNDADESDKEVPCHEQSTTSKIKDRGLHTSDQESPVCSKTCNSRLQLKKHVMEDHFFNCKICEDVFQNKILLEEHLVQSHNIHNPQFSSRLIKFWSKQKDSHSIIVPYTCPVIDPKPKDIASLALMSNHHGDCEIVGEFLPSNLPDDAATDEDSLRGDFLHRNLDSTSDIKSSINTQPQLIHSLKTHPAYKRKCKSKGSHYKDRKKNHKKLDLEETHTPGEAGKHSVLSISKSKARPLKKEPNESGPHHHEGTDNDSFTKCFLKEVEIKQEAEASSDTGLKQEEIVQIKDCSLVGCLNTGNLLYVYPLVEIRTGYNEEEETEVNRDGHSNGYVGSTGDVPKIGVFYHQPITNEASDDTVADYGGMDTSQSSNSFEAENLTSKVFIVSPLDRDVDTSSSDDTNMSEEDALWSQGTYMGEVPADSDIELMDETINDPLLNHSNRGSNSHDEYDRCILCKCSFPDKTQLQKHMLSKHIDEYYNKCCICFKRFETIFKVRSHVMMEHIDVQCKCCQRRFLKSTSLRKHMVKHSVHKFQSTFKRCEICLKMFHTATDLADHVQTVHPLFLKHQCDLCDKTFLTEEELFIHVDEDPHVCLLCSGYFQSTLSLREHLLGHARDRQVLELFTSRDRGVQ